MTIPTNVDGPSLSVVVTARNDDHGGNLLQRMQVFVTNLLEQARQHHLQMELLLVEWNPPPDKPSLAEVLVWPEIVLPGWVRIIQVPLALHRRYQYAEALPLFQMMAKNVGIRRARGRFILATTVDLLFSDELIHFLASDNLRANWLYRIDRHDVPADVSTQGSLEEQLAYCHQHIIRTHARQGVFADSRPPQNKIELGWALLAHFLWLAKSTQIEQNSAPSLTLSNLRRRWSYQVSLVQRGLIRLKDLIRPSFPRLHITASGDFTLMAREHWWALRGYPELEVFSMHLDSVLCYMAHYAGIKEKVLNDPIRIYHLEHAGGWTPAIDRNQSLDQQLDSAGIPQVSRQQLRPWILQMQQTQRPLIFNDEQWGLAGEDLPELKI